MNRILLCLVSLSLASLLSAQNIQVTGTLSDATTNEPLAYAHVGILGTAVGTVTNSSGQFSLLIPEEHQSKKLSFSYLGYQTKSLEIIHTENLKVSLSPTSTSLPELVITKDKTSLIEEAIERIPENHDQENMQMSGFWRAQVRNSKKHIQLSETAFDLYRLEKDDALKITKSRACRDSAAYDRIKHFNAGIAPKGIFRSSFLVDMIILSKKVRKQHEFELVDATMYNDRPVLILAFDRKKSSKENGYKGRILLDSETLAFVHISYGFSPSNPEPLELFDGWLYKKISGLGNSIWEKHDSEYNFQEVNGKWYLLNVQHDVLWTLIDNDETFEKPVHYYGDLVITNIQKGNIVLPDKDERAGKSILISQKANFSDDYWEGFNYIVPDQDFDRIFREIEEINKSYKRPNK